MKTHLAIAIKLTVITALLFGGLYPLLITGIAKVVAPNGGKGEEISVKGKIIGFELIGQKFDQDNYFTSRPSAVDYNAASTGGSNKGPTNPDYLGTVKARVDTFLVHNPTINKGDVPVDLVTASAGGLDPHISIHAALVQVPRVARIRKLSPHVVESLVRSHIEYPVLGIGTSKVHVLRLNLALDQLK